MKQVLMTAACVLAMSTAPAIAKDWKTRLADKGVAVEAAYTIDTVSVSGGADSDTYTLDNLDVIVDVDLDKALGWSGMQLHVYGLANNGDMPNDGAGTLEGVNNIEAGLHRGKLYEFWLQKTFAVSDATEVSVLAGLYDVNSEFYATAASDVFINPAFGIGSELAATGLNGPSIFPSTGLAVRAKVSHGDAYGQVVAVNADARTWGDPDGIDTDFDAGSLIVAEAGVDGTRKFALGLWHYTQDFADIRTGDPADAQGIYVLFDTPIWTQDDITVRGFFRGGLSDGDTGDFDGSWQAGVSASGLFGRENSVLGFGVHQGLLGAKYRANVLDDDSIDLDRAETGFELTYADTLGEHITIQPDLQYILNPGGDPDVDAAFVATLRLILSL